jgi:hypothetical protein
MRFFITLQRLQQIIISLQLFIHNGIQSRNGNVKDNAIVPAIA